MRTLDGLLALSVRQPWAWAIIHAGKDLENRSGFSVHKMGFKPNMTFAIHAAKGMTRAEYEEARDYMRRVCHVECPPPGDLLRGGIIGTARFDGIIGKSANPWFMGPKAIAMKDQQPVDFIPCQGQLGLFKWTETEGGAPDKPAKWMLPKPAAPAPAEALL